MKAAPRTVPLGIFNVGERKDLIVSAERNGTVHLRQVGNARGLTTSISRIWFSAIRTQRMNEVRDRERAARRRLENGRNGGGR